MQGLTHTREVTMASLTDGLEYYNACYCAGTCCGGHLVFRDLPVDWTPIGWQGAAQHTYTTACDGHHAPGPCPPSAHRHHFVMVTGGMACACGERIP
jgi:hypothetical protein